MTSFLRGVRRFSLPGVAAIAAAGAVVAVSIGAAGTSANSIRPASRFHLATSRTASTAAVAGFGVLRRPSNRSDAIVASSMPSLQATLFNHAGIDPAGGFYSVETDTARRVYPSASSQMWVTAGTEGTVCKVIRPMIWAARVPVFHAICLPPSEVAVGMSVGVQGVPPDVEVDGLVPDGVPTVAIALGDGGVVQASVSANAYDVVVPGAVIGVSFVGAEGTVAVPIHSCSASC